MEHNQEIMEQFLKLLSENGRAGQSEDLSRLLFYMDGMNRQLDAVRQELQTVRVQLAQAQDTPQKTVLQGMVDGLQNKVRQAQEKLDGLREKIMPDCRKGGIVHGGEHLVDCPHGGKDSGLEAPLLPAVHGLGFPAGHGAPCVFQMPAHAAEFVAKGFYFLNVLSGIGQGTADILLNRFQRLVDAHSGNRLIQRSHAHALETLYRVGGALHDFLPQAVQLFLRLLDFALQRVHHALQDGFLRRVLGLCKLYPDGLQFLAHRVKLAVHAWQAGKLRTFLKTAILFIC